MLSNIIIMETKEMFNLKWSLLDVLPSHPF